MKMRSAWSRPAVWVAMLSLACSLVGFDMLNAGDATAAVQETLYASPSGTGTACSPSSPCSLSQAKSTVESLDGSGQDVTVQGGATTQGQADIVQEPVSGDAAAQRLPRQQSDGSWQFKNQNSGLRLDVYGAGSNLGRQLDQWPCKNAPGTNQDFIAR